MTNTAGANLMGVKSNAFSLTGATASQALLSLSLAAADIPQMQSQITTSQVRKSWRSKEGDENEVDVED